MQQPSLSESERSQGLLHDLLPAKGKDSVADFCKVLLHTEGQEHLLDAETVAMLPGEETRVKGGDLSYGPPGPQGNSAVSTDCLFPRAENISHLQDVVSVQSQDVPLNLKKRKQSCTTYLPSKARRMNSATFFFKPEHREVIKPIENIIASMCVECFGIERSMIMFSYAEMADLKTMVKLWGRPCFMDLDSKLAVLWVDGIDHEQVDSHKIAIWKS